MDAHGLRGICREPSGHGGASGGDESVCMCAQGGSYLAQLDGEIAGGDTDYSRRRCRIVRSEHVGGISRPRRAIRVARNALGESARCQLRLSRVPGAAGVQLRAQCGEAGVPNVVYAGEVRACLDVTATTLESAHHDKDTRSMCDALLNESDDVLRGSSWKKNAGDAGFF